MAELSLISQEVQQIAEAISLAVGCDVEVIDDARTRMAATGTIKHTQGQKLSHGHVYQYALQNKQTVIVDYPGRHFLCSSCIIAKECYYLLTIAAPILVDGSPVGVLAVIAFDTETANQIRQKMVNLTDFVERMASLMAAKIKEYRLLKSLDLAMAELTGILNKVEKGLVAFSADGNVLHFNKTAVDLLGLGNHPDIARGIQAAAGHFIGMDSQSRPSVVTLGLKSLLLDVETIAISGDAQSETLTLVSFRDYAAVKKTASCMTIAARPITFTDILTQNAGMQKLINFAKKIAKSSSTVLLRGESGTGKELFARAIHYESGRSGPFIPINCGAIPETLLESEFFGYDSGAFTGARREGKPGKFELAEGGTLFLDELGTMPIHLQSKLLRVLEERRVERLGGKQSFAVDVRIVAATNENLEELVQAGRFREDLFFRVNVIPIYLLPLRERVEDIPLLAAYYLNHYFEKMGKKIDRLAVEVEEAMMTYEWPGNIREFANVLEYAVNVEESSVLTLNSLPSQFDKAPAKASNPQYQTKRQELRNLLHEHGWGKAGKQQAAEILGVSLATIYRWVNAFNLKPK
ncbi:sigma-54 interaction domain-containing protein [Sporomusa termitida]|uniref:Anaerobic nitric oxide reductase transcription regulator NorR n=1 Tax=Sporomusa termitida TaxID=2377 RepID=A0A517DQQ0_9FIRM|nr:sigma 54-interacting transcriptional regulator [Sporomusa termitida]QDR79692.1 Anaerobic nitric oxide reductase transcription regulator NorR [Sporomusa termitida]